MTHLPTTGRPFLAALALTVLLAPANPAAASVVQHDVTPQNVAGTDGIDVSARRLANGDIELTLRVEQAPSVYRPRVKLRANGPETRAEWTDPAASPLVATVRVPAVRVSEAVVTVMRDFGLIGHSYVIRVRDWVPQAGAGRPR